MKQESRNKKQSKDMSRNAAEITNLKGQQETYAYCPDKNYLPCLSTRILTLLRIILDLQLGHSM